MTAGMLDDAALGAIQFLGVFRGLGNMYGLGNHDGYAAGTPVFHRLHPELQLFDSYASPRLLAANSQLIR